MRKLLFIIVLLLISASAWATNTAYVSRKGASGILSGAHTMSCPNAVTFSNTANYEICQIAYYSSGTTPQTVSISCTTNCSGVSWTQLVPQTNIVQGSSNFAFAVWISPVGQTSSATTSTVSVSTGLCAVCYIEGISYEIVTTGVLDGSAVTASGTGLTYTTASLTLASSNEALNSSVALVLNTGTAGLASFAAGTGFSVIPSYGVTHQVGSSCSNTNEVSADMGWSAGTSGVVTPSATASVCAGSPVEDWAMLAYALAVSGGGAIQTMPPVVY